MTHRIERIGDAELHLADCRDVLPTLSGVDALVSDPPYGIGFCHGAGGDGIGGGKYVSRFNGIPVVGDDKPFDPSDLLGAAPITVLWGGNHFADRLPSNSCWLVWDKREGHTRNDFADCEMAWTNLRGVARLKRHYWNGMMRASEKGIPRVHPTQKPIAVMEWVLEECGLQGGALVADPYMGSGTTGVAAIRRGLRFVGVEVVPEYFDIACKRIEEASKQGDLIRDVLPKPQQKAMEL
jgi:site-specific DNA-methyltransferase (adenine-specific)